MESSVFDRFLFYADMAEADKKLLRESVIRKELASGEIMMGDQSRCAGIPIVMSGRLRLFRLSEKGREMTLYRVGAGELCLLAGVCAMGSVVYDFSVEAERNSVIATIPPEAFKELLYRSKPFMTHVFGALAQKLILSIETIEMLIFNSIEERIMAYLQRHANAAGEVKTTHEKMAVELGSSREVISRQLKKMADNGTLTLKRGRIVVKIICE
jgi:CRP/FNR family transcriptional regulator, anaerobic regulatory protein